MNELIVDDGADCTLALLEANTDDPPASELESSDSEDSEGPPDLLQPGHLTSDEETDENTDEETDGGSETEGDEEQGHEAGKPISLQLGCRSRFPAIAAHAGPPEQEVEHMMEASIGAPVVSMLLRHTRPNCNPFRNS